MNEVTVPEAWVHEYLGVRLQPRVVNLSILNALGRRWVDLADVLGWLDRNAETLDLNILRRLARELRDVTEG